jgi:hypothetical protein
MVLPGTVAGVFNGLVDRSITLSAAEPGEKLQGDGGTLSNLAITATGVFSGVLGLEDDRQVFTGALTKDGDRWAAITSITRGAGGPALTLKFSIDPLTGELTGSLTDGRIATPVGLRAWRNSWDAATHPATALAGVYPANLPDNGPLTLSIGTDGQVAWTGRLADGTRITGGSTMGPMGEIPFHEALPDSAKGGALHAWLPPLSEGTSDLFPDETTPRVPVR